MAKVKPDTIIACPPLITEKVRQFDEHLETYTSGDYSEAQLRVDFLNPMIEALGWDVNNDKGYAEAYRDVVYEDAIKVAGTTKAPDYGFYIGGRAAGGGRKFFLEAKKPSVAIRVDPKSAFQLRRYAFSAQLPLSILTNFKEFIAYDTRFKPSAKDSATAAAVLRIQYTEYIERWHEIASVFSRDAILRGAFDKFARGKRKRGMEPLGESFLKDIEGWRDLLAREIATSNPDISVDDLNFAVQRTIDRILFLRICEDRGIEPPHNLMQLLNGDKVYDRLGQIFRGADDRYNSGIFHFPPPVGKKPDPDRAEPPDDLTLDLTIDDKPLKQIIRGLYDMPGLFTSYAFAVIPPEILGHVYEQFLGKVIRLTAGHRVKIEEKPEVRKAGGVYYTPVYIVDYIVKNTVGKLLEGKSPKDAAKLRILDPASGSGSFLIGAYQFLLDWHLGWYLENDPEKHRKGRNPALMRIYAPSFAEEPDATPKPKASRDYRLTTHKRREILLNSIYGVDIDPQAVEVTKLSLLLKVLEGESQESIAAQMKFRHQRALPDLGRNIKCGNSLIGDDFDDGELSEDERKKINKFNWETAFPSIFKAGGFDAVIGNPPYGADLGDLDRHYLRGTYKCGSTDTAALFVEFGIDRLAHRGRLGFIIPKPFTYASNWAKLRLLATPILETVVDVSKVWREVKLEQCIVLLSKSEPSPSFQSGIRNGTDLHILGEIEKETIDRFGFLLNSVSPEEVALACRVQSDCMSLSKLTENRRGAMLQKLVSEKGDYLVIGGKQLSRWRLEPDPKRRIDSRILDDEQARLHDNAVLVQNIVAHIQRPIDHVMIIAAVPSEDDRNKCIILDTVNQLQCRRHVDPYFVCAILNSRFVAWYAYRFLFAKAVRTMHFDAVTSSKLVVPKHDPNNDLPTKAAAIAREITAEHQLLGKRSAPHAKEARSRNIALMSERLNTIIYDLYGLSKNDVRLIENTTPNRDLQSGAFDGFDNLHEV